jgi:hypothetical protein
MYTHKYKNKGAILIELMLTIALSLVLLVTLIQLYLTSMRSLHMQVALHNMRHHASSAIGALRFSIHQSGYIGCARLTSDFPIKSVEGFTLTPENKLHSEHLGELTVRYADPVHETLIEGMHNRYFIKVTRDHVFQEGDFLIISNCQKAEIFRVKKVYLTRHSQLILPMHLLQDRYEKNSEVARLVVNKFFVNSTLHEDDDEIANDIHDLQFSFTISEQGMFTDLPPEKIEDWSKVVGVSVRLTVSSPPYQKVWYAYIKV